MATALYTDSVTVILCWCLVVLQIAPSAAFTKPLRERDVVLQQCRALFGDPVDADLDLFEVRSDYVLQPSFDAKGHLRKIYVAPKHYFENEHPEWAGPATTPPLSDDEFKSLLAKIGVIREIGPLEQKATLGISGGGRTPFTDRYRGAYVERISIGSEKEDGPERLRAFEVYYPRLHNGRIEAKQAAMGPFQPFYLVKSDGAWYFVSAAEFEKLSVGQTVEFLGAGRN